MEPTTFFAIILIFWSSLHLIQSALLNSSYFGERVENLLLDNHITISPFNIRWFTASWNRYFIWIGRMWKSKLKYWFDAGVLFAVIAMISGTILLCHTLLTSIREIFFKPELPVPENQQVLAIIVPGINLPIEHAWYLLTAVFLSGILHEFGHAIAAAREGIQINGFGFFAFFIYPGAFVDLHSEDVNRKEPICQLRVFCAGVWHNFVICLAACVFIVALPVLLFPFYTTHIPGILVTHLKHDSPLVGSKGLRIGDHLTRIDDCIITNSSDWYYCLNKTKKPPQWGTCISLEKLTSLSSHTSYKTANLPKSHPGGAKDEKYWIDCCDVDAPPTHLCYKYTQNKQSPVTMFSCLPGRALMSSNRNYCYFSEDCSNTNENNDVVCAQAHTESGTKLIQIEAIRHETNSEKHNVLFIGDPRDILQSVTVSEYFPRYFLFPLSFPLCLQRFLQYLFSMSGALALLNIIPCYALDGQWAFGAFLNYWSERNVLTPQSRENILVVTLFCGTLLIAANIIVGFIQLFSR